MKPVLNLYSSENPQKCPYCGERTEWREDEGLEKGVEAEYCRNCDQLYHVYDMEDEE